MKEKERERERERETEGGRERDELYLGQLGKLNTVCPPHEAKEKREECSVLWCDTTAKLMAY